MKVPSIIVGIAAAGVLLALLALTRLLVPRVEATGLELREVELAPLPEPPPPPPDEAPPVAPPLPPLLTEVSALPDPTRVAVPKAEVPMDVRLPVDPFFTDLAPAPLPQPVARREVPRAGPAPTAPRPAPAAKSVFDLGELDGRPQLIRHISVPFPRSLTRRGVSEGTVIFEIEINEEGAVKVRRMVSSTHPELVASARRVAASARFTPPTRHGQPVKAIMRWPITIRN